jgi:hypothetical protein
MRALMSTREFEKPVAIRPRVWRWPAASRELGARAAAVVAKFAPYAAIELVMPGGSLVALLLWLYRRRRSDTYSPSL